MPSSNRTNQPLHKRPIDTLRRHPLGDFAWRILVILVGDFLGAVAVNNFIVPAHILSGGVTGISQIIHHFLHPLGIGTLYLLLNIPLFLLGYRYLGYRFVIFTGIAIAGFSFMTDAVHLHFHTVTDPLVLGLYGGVLNGISGAIVIRVGGSMGGSDILSLVLYRLSGKSVGATGFIINAVVVLVSLWIFGIPAGMYTLVSMFAASRVYMALMHYQQRKTALIVTSKAEEISQTIYQQLGRGSTLIKALGTYTNSPLGVLMCAMTSLEIDDLKGIAMEIDTNVFITVLDTTEVIGRFRHTSP